MVHHCFTSLFDQLTLIRFPNIVFYIWWYRFWEHNISRSWILSHKLFCLIHFYSRTIFNPSENYSIPLNTFYLSSYLVSKHTRYLKFNLYWILIEMSIHLLAESLAFAWRCILLDSHMHTWKKIVQEILKVHSFSSKYRLDPNENIWLELV